MKTTVGKLKQLLESVVLEDESTKDSLISFIMEELHAEFVSKYDIVSVRPRGKASKQDDMITLRPVVSLIDKDLVYRVFGDIAQSTFHCVWDVTGDQPHIELHKPSGPRSNTDGPHALIETADIRIAIMMNTFGYISLHLFRQDKKEHIKETVSAQVGYQSLLDQAMQDMLSANKTLEKAHEQAPAGAPKAIIMGLHSDVFNTIATFREYVGKLKGLKEARDVNEQDARVLRDAVFEALVDEFMHVVPPGDMKTSESYEDPLVSIELLNQKWESFHRSQHTVLSTIRTVTGKPVKHWASETTPMTRAYLSSGGIIVSVRLYENKVRGTYTVTLSVGVDR